MRNDPREEMAAFLGRLSDQMALQPISIDSVLAEKRPSRTDSSDSAAASVAVLTFLSVLGILSIDWETREFTINSITASYALRSLRECLRSNVTLITDWEREGVSEEYIDVDELAGSGVDFLYWLETGRKMVKGAQPVKVGNVSKAIIKARSNDGKEVFLVQRSDKSGRYQLIRGRRRSETETPITTMKRELKEELRGNRFNYGRNTILRPLESIPIELVSPTFGAFTRWECQYFSVEFCGLDLVLPAGTCWATMDEFRQGYLVTGEPILRFPEESQQRIFDVFENAPLSIESAVDLDRQRELYVQSSSASGVDSLYNLCRQHHTGRVSPLSMIDLICMRFPAFVRGLNRRHGDRSGLDVKDEHDVQDLLGCILSLFFSDTRPEEWTPSYAGKASRMDFLLKEQGIVIETKMTRSKTASKTIGDELIVDISRYRTHPDCKALYCFVYDPEIHIRNPVGMERDLARSDDDLQVKVRVVQGR